MSRGDRRGSAQGHADIEVPAQAGDDSALEDRKRGDTAADYAAGRQDSRRIRDVAIATDAMRSPGESEDQFQDDDLLGSWSWTWPTWRCDSPARLRSPNGAWRMTCPREGNGAASITGGAAGGHRH